MISNSIMRDQMPSVCRSKYGALRDLVPFVQYKKHPWRSANFSKVTG